MRRSSVKFCSSPKETVTDVSLRKRAKLETSLRERERQRERERERERTWNTRIDSITSAYIRSRHGKTKSLLINKSCLRQCTRQIFTKWIFSDCWKIHVQMYALFQSSVTYFSTVVSLPGYTIETIR